MLPPSYLDQMPDAWASQVAGPHAKITASLKA